MKQLVFHEMGYGYDTKMTSIHGQKHGKDDKNMGNVGTLGRQ